MSSSVDITSFHDGFSVFQDIESGKLPKIISRIAQCLSNNGNSDEAFSSEEKTKLQEVLGVESTGVSLLLRTISDCFHFAAYHGMKPQVLAQKLEEHVNETVADIMSKAWQKYGRDITAALKKSVISSNRLSKIDWQLNLQVAQGSKSRISEPNVVFKLETKTDDGKEASDFLLEMNHEELLSFYSKLETIQEQLDALT